MTNISVEVLQAGRGPAEIPTDFVLQLHVTDRDSITELMVRPAAKRLVQMKRWTETIRANSDKLLGEIAKIQKGLDKRLNALRHACSGLRGVLRDGWIS